jgi:predicted Fe-Mo cluster-binding NifX family protein
MMVPFLGRIPIDPEIVEATDNAIPYLVNKKDSSAGKAFDEIVNKIMERSVKEIKRPTPSLQKTAPRSETPLEVGKAMKIAIPLERGRLSSHFGHCEEFAFIDIEDRHIKNKTLMPPPPHEPGALPRWLHEHGVNLIIAGGMGQRAQGLFAENDIEVVIGAPSLAPEELVNQYMNGALTTGPNICDH